MATSDIRLTAPLADTAGKNRRLPGLAAFQAASEVRLPSPARGITAQTRECQLACAAPLATLIAHIVQVHHQHLRDQLFGAWTLLDQLAFEAPRGCSAPRAIREAFEILVDALVDCMRREQRSVFPQLQFPATADSRTEETSLAEAIRGMEQCQFNCLLAVRRLNEARGQSQAVLLPCVVFPRLLATLEALSSELFQYLFEVNCVLFKRAKAADRPHLRPK